MAQEQRDVFLSHASEDKEGIVYPLARELRKRGVSFWLDEAELQWGDRIAKRLNDGLRLSRYVVVVLSPNFLRKGWPQAELEAALNRENSEGKTVVLPLLAGPSDEILAMYPLLSHKVCLEWHGDAVATAHHLQNVLLGHPKEPEDPSPSFLEPTLTDLLYLQSRTRRELQSDAQAQAVLFLESMFRPKCRDIPIDELISQAPAELRNPLEQLARPLHERFRRLKNEVGSEEPSDGSLEFVRVGWTHEGEFDVQLRNLSSNSIYITRIKLLLLREAGYVMPILQPSARYNMPINDLDIGDSKSLNVSHVIAPHNADRFLVATGTTRVLLVRVTLDYNKKFSLSHNAWLWGQFAPQE